MKARRPRSRSILLGAGAVTASLALVTLLAVGYSAWNSSVSVSKTVSAATVPTPKSASGVAGSTTTSSSYGATYDGYYCPPLVPWKFSTVYDINGSIICDYTNLNNPDNHLEWPSVSEYSCPSGGTLSGTDCITTTTPDIKFTWATPTAYDASGQDFVTGVDVVEGSSCSTSSWKVVATVSPSTDSYTVDNPSTSEYYGLQTKGLGGWTSTVSGCTLG